MPKSWYEIKNAATEAADVFLYDEIGMWGITANDFAKDLRAISAPVINLRLNSPGGEVFDGIAIYNSLKNHPAAVNVFVDGLAASSASFIAQAGDKITMAKNATMMIHEPYGMAMGDAATMSKMAEELDLVAGTIADIYTERAGSTTDEWRTAMKAESWYKAQDAVDAGLADEVAGAAPKNATAQIFNLSKFKNVPKWVNQAKAAARTRVADAGRTMSQANLDKLHGAMGDIGSVHDGTCDMGADCPQSAAGAATNRARTPRNDSGSVCMVPECDEPWAIDLPLCKDHTGMVMDLAGDPPPPDEAAEGEFPANAHDIYRYRAALLDIDNALVGRKAS